MDLKTSALGRLEGQLRACFFSDSTLADFSDDAYFWSGELFLAQEMYEDAKLSFKNVVDNFYQHSRAPDSLFKLGEIYRIEGDIARSLGFYNRVNEDFPDSGASQLSKKSQEILIEESKLLE